MRTEPGLLGYWFDIYDRWKLVACTAGVAAASALLISLLLPPIYQATVVFYPAQNVVAPNYLAGNSSLAQTPFVPVSEEKAASISIGILRSRDMFRELERLFPQRSAGELQKNVSIEVSREFMVQVFVRDRDPAMAASIAGQFPELLRNFHRDQIRDHMEAVAAAARNELAMVERRLAETRSGVDPIATDDELAAASLRGMPDEVLRATAERLRSVLREAITQSREPSAPVVVVEHASPGERPVFPIPLLNTIVAGITGLAFGCYYALFCGFLDRLRHVRAVRRLRLPPLREHDLTATRQALRSSQG